MTGIQLSANHYLGRTDERIRCVESPFFIYELNRMRIEFGTIPFETSSIVKLNLSTSGAASCAHVCCVVACVRELARNAIFRCASADDNDSFWTLSFIRNKTQKSDYNWALTIFANELNIPGTEMTAMAALMINQDVT